MLVAFKTDKGKTKDVPIIVTLSSPFFGQQVGVVKASEAVVRTSKSAE